ncbi:hypothetical protein TIFTF001_026932 [Ficus carica]|uniref:Uncharacterized protein n=1 Tax=Ficus carica TaxID=3494 RepID=A0AA88DM35_FICCA|nr:hypothetical protein TIFTF001_026932 [Ficus carica]
MDYTTVSGRNSCVGGFHDSFSQKPSYFSYPLSPLPAADSAVALPAAAFHLSHSPGDTTAALPSSSFDRRPQCRHPLSLILPLPSTPPSTPPSPLSPFSTAAAATSVATCLPIKAVTILHQRKAR